jgi:predicted Zn-dependent protease with MMP-like domain
MDASTFDTMVADALDDLPEAVASPLENVEVLVEDWPSAAQTASTGLSRGETLFGLYEGIPLTGRTSSYSLVLPDRITVFRGPILDAARTPAAVRRQVRLTVIHEIAHHFGIDDDRLADLGAY